MDLLQFYSTDSPNINENVLVHFIEKKDSYFKAKLIEYPLYEGILNFQDATKKKKIKSWNNIVVLNKNTVSKVEDIDIDKKIVKLSLIYLENKNSMEYFNENKLMEKFIKSFCIINKYDFILIWTDIIYKIDILRREDNIDISLWNYFINNRDLLNNDIYNKLIEYYISKYENINKKIISKFGIISNIGIDIIKTIFNNVLSNINYNYTLKYISAPNYIFESNDKNDHNIFFNNINNEINNYTKIYNKQVVFIKIEFIEKICNN
jgi:translation initiation factor 2 alpha subunit (eIF-2alpha)